MYYSGHNSNMAKCLERCTKNGGRSFLHSSGHRYKAEGVCFSNHHCIVDKYNCDTIFVSVSAGITRVSVG